MVRYQRRKSYETDITQHRRAGKLDRHLVREQQPALSLLHLNKFNKITVT
ncbi:hypothetical protein SAMN05216309_11710 [Nitrosomonas europaea]|nr:hypothetical protein SAMN05216309_11710 [Nitrosomonas europaea]SJZ58365.1 hypothetical protein SAMN02745113_01331 [Nitrosomonas europaea]